jgi:antitoxin HigA-1
MMTTSMHNPPHPGEVLREYLPPDMSVTAAALKIGVSRQAFSKLLNGRAGVSAEMAWRLSSALQTSAEFWMNLQQAHDLWQVRQAGLPKVESLAA